MRATRAVLAGFACALLGACAAAPASDELYDLLRVARGELIDAQTHCSDERGRYRLCVVRFASSTGVQVRGRMLLPRDAHSPVPGVLLNAGLWIGTGVIDALPADLGEVAILAIEYPESIPHRLDVSKVLAKRARLLRAGRETAVRFSLAGEFLAAHHAIDPERIAIIGGSFAVPFTGLAAAIDERFHNVALIYGAGEFPSVLAANFRFLPGPLNDVAARMVARPFLELEPARHVHLIAPRPLLMINGEDDHLMPLRAVRHLFDAAGAPKEMIWMRGGHLHSRDDQLIAALVDTAFSRLPVLRGIREPH